MELNNKKDKQINLNNYAKLVYNFKKKLNCNIIFEPGRSLVGNTGILVSKIQYIKKGLNKNFIIIDAGMNDFMRTALYDAIIILCQLLKQIKKSRTYRICWPNL